MTTAHAFGDDMWRTVDPPSDDPPADDPPAVPICDPTTLEGLPIPERRWIAEQWLPVGEVTSLYADGGTGKTLAAQQLQTASAVGAYWLNLPTTRCRSFGLYCEDDDGELHRRQARINQHYDVRFRDLGDMRWWARAGCDNALVAKDGDTTTFFAEFRARVKEFGARLVIVDTKADVFLVDEFSTALVRRCIHVLAGLAKEIDGAVLMLAHPSVASMVAGRGTSGNVQWNNAVRSRWYMEIPEPQDGETPDDVSNRRVLTRKKANYAKVGEFINMAWVDGVLVAETDPIMDTVDRIAAASRAGEAEIAFLTALDRLNDQGRNVSHSRNAPNYAPKVMKLLPEVKGFRPRELADAMERLFAAGRIVAGAAVGKDAHRKPKYGLARAPKVTVEPDLEAAE